MDDTNTPPANALIVALKAEGLVPGTDHPYPSAIVLSREPHGPAWARHDGIGDLPYPSVLELCAEYKLDLHATIRDWLPDDRRALSGLPIETHAQVVALVELVIDSQAGLGPAWVPFDYEGEGPTRFFASLDLPGLGHMRFNAIAVENEPGSDNGRRAVCEDDQEELERWCTAAEIAVGETVEILGLRCLVFGYPDGD